MDRLRARSRAVLGLADRSPYATFLLAAVPVAIVYALTASWWVAQSPDSFTNLLTARAVAERGSLYLDEDAQLTELRDYGVSIIDTDGGRLASRYQPAASLHAVPLYLLARGHTVGLVADPITSPPPRPIEDYRVPPAWPGALTSVLLVGAAVGTMALTFRQMAAGSVAVLAAYTIGLGTSLWSVAADELWQHTPGVFWLAIGGYATARTQAATSALGYGIAAAVRPFNAVVGGVVALRHLFSHRRWIAVAVGAGVGIGIGSVIATNAVVFGTPSIQGGYRGGDVFSDTEGLGPLWYPLNYLRGLLHPRYGLLTWSPFVALLLARVPRAYRTSPVWCRGPAIGGAIYLLMHWTIHRASGGAGFLFYRYPLEALVACAPLLFWTYLDQVRTDPRRNRLFGLLVLIGVVGHSTAALTLR